METEKRCDFCNKPEQLIPIHSAVHEGEAIDTCNECAKLNNVILIKKPTEAELSILSQPSYKFAELRQKIKEGKRLNDSPRNNLPAFDPDKVRGRVWRTAEEKFAVRKERVAEKIGAKEEPAIVEDASADLKEEKDSAGINFKSKFLKIGDLKRLKERFFGKKEPKTEKIEEDETITPEPSEDKATEGIEIIDIEKE